MTIALFLKLIFISFILNFIIFLIIGRIEYLNLKRKDFDLDSFIKEVIEIIKYKPTRNIVIFYYSLFYIIILITLIIIKILTNLN